MNRKREEFARSHEQGARLIPEDPDIDAQVMGWVLQSSLRDDVKYGESLGTSIPLLSAPVIKACINRQSVFDVVRKSKKHPVFSRRLMFLCFEYCRLFLDSFSEILCLPLQKH